MSVTILTTQNVEIEYQIASIGDRVLAALVDLFICFAYGIALFLILGAIDISPGLAALVIMYLPVFLYDLMFEVLMDGQSPGKRVLGIRVVKLDGSQPTVGSYLLRWLFRIIDLYFFTVGLLVLIINGKGQRLGDIAAGTTVIKVGARPKLHETLYPDVEAEYVPVFPQVTRLTDRDIALIKQVMSAGRKHESAATLLALRDRLKLVLQVEPDMPPQQFLQTVLKDYAYYTQGMVSDLEGMRPVR